MAPEEKGERVLLSFFPENRAEGGKPVTMTLESTPGRLPSHLVGVARSIEVEIQWGKIIFDLLTQILGGLHLAPNECLLWPTFRWTLLHLPRVKPGLTSLLPSRKMQQFLWRSHLSQSVPWFQRCLLIYLTEVLRCSTVLGCLQSSRTFWSRSADSEKKCLLALNSQHFQQCAGT